MRSKSATPQGPAGVRAGSLQAWSVAVRPRSLLVALSPVLVGGTLGFARQDPISPLAAAPLP